MGRACCCSQCWSGGRSMPARSRTGRSGARNNKGREPMPIAFDAADLAATRKANDFLARMPRLRLQSTLHRNLVQGLMALGNRFGPDFAARAGVAAEERTVTALG